MINKSKCQSQNCSQLIPNNKNFCPQHHNEINFDTSRIETGLPNAILHSEAPLKETYNTCSIALSNEVNNKGIKVILSGEGA